MLISQFWFYFNKKLIKVEHHPTLVYWNASIRLTYWLVNFCFFWVFMTTSQLVRICLYIAIFNPDSQHKKVFWPILPGLLKKKEERMSELMAAALIFSRLVLLRMTVLLVVCLTQSWLLWKFIRFQLRRWREFRHEQAVRKKATAKQPVRQLKRDTCELLR